MAIKASALGIIFCGVPSAAVSAGCFMHTKSNGGASSTVAESEEAQKSSGQVEIDIHENPAAAKNESPHEVAVDGESDAEDAQPEIEAEGEKEVPKAESVQESAGDDLQQPQERNTDSALEPAPSVEIPVSDSLPETVESSTGSLEPEAHTEEANRPTVPEQTKKDSEDEKSTKRDESGSELEKTKAPEVAPKKEEGSGWGIFSWTIGYLRGR